MLAVAPWTSSLPEMSRSFWIETLGCPKNQVDSDKLTGTMLRDGLVPAGAPEDADLVVVNTCAFIDEARHESIDVILALSDRPVRRRRARRHRLHGRALRRRAGRRPARGRRGRRVRGAGHPRPDARSAPTVPVARPAEPAPPPGRRPVGLREGGRGLRPGLRVLRHPVVPGQAAQPPARRRGRRGRRAGRVGRARGRPRRPGPGRLRPRPGPGRAPRSCRWSRRWPGGSIGSACCTCTRPTSRRR